MSVNLHGENGITYALFTELYHRGKIKEFIDLIDLIEGRKIDTTSVEEMRVHLFPSFGRRDGFGEPDAIILTDKFYVLFEVKTKSFFEASITKGGITYQLERFYSLGRTLSDDGKIKEIREKGEIKGEFLISDIASHRKPRKVKINQAIDNLVGQMIELKDNYYIVCLTNNEKFPDEYKNYLNNANKFLISKNKEELHKNKFGWIGYNKIMKLGLPLTQSAIELNGVTKSD